MSASTVEKGAAPAAADAVAANNNTNDVASAPAAAEGADAKQDKGIDAAAAASAAEGRRLYIGNLAYAATDANIREFFTGYEIEAVTIPKNPRTDKAVGYAFVDLVSAADSERAITELAGHEVLERKVSVQIAHKPDEAAEKKDGEGGRRGTKAPRSRARSGHGRGGARKDAEGGADAAAAGDSNAATDGSASAAAGAGEGAQAHGQEHGNERGNARHRRNDSSHGQQNQQHQQHQRRERGPPADGVPSKSKVMVANLPYDLSEEKLKELFAEYNPTSAKIALRPIPRFMIKKLQDRAEPRKGRGFGFVSFASEEIQQKAVAEMNAKVIDGREIAVKVAVDSPDKTDEALAAKAAAALNLSAEQGDKPAGGDAAEIKDAAPATEAPAS